MPTAPVLSEFFKNIEITMAPPGSAHLNFSLGGLVALGGAMGYMKKGSTMSLADPLH